MIRGLDVSYAQGRIPQSDWAQLVTNGVKFCYAKVAEGMGSRPDAQCADHVKAARAAGMRVGGYFFAHFRPGIDPEAQAEIHHQLAVLEGLNLPGDLPPMLDLEWPDPRDWMKLGCTPDQLRRDAIAWLHTTRELWGTTPGIYTYPDFWMHVGGGVESRFSSYHLWAANYTRQDWPGVNDRPLILKPWTAYSFWQWTGSGKLPSGGAVDYDVFCGDDLSAILQKPSDPMAGLNPLVIAPDATPDVPPPGKVS